MTRRFLFVVFALTFLVSGRAFSEDGVVPRPLGRELPAYVAPSDPEEPSPENPMPKGDLALRDALAAALRGNPELASLSWAVRSREARALQANVRPNPSITVELEDFGGSGERRAFDSNQTTISIAQLVELGGKRAKRTRVAELETELASWDYETRRIAVLADTAKSFLLVLSLQERRQLLRELEKISVEGVRSVASTVKAGAVSPIEEDRARVTLERVQLEAVRAEKELERARALLSASWGASTATFSLALGDLARAPEPPDLARLLAATDESPEIARWNAEVNEREAVVALERARRLPDVTASLGGRYYTDGGDAGVVAMLSVPIPLFDRNRGNILDARYRVAQASTDRRIAEVTVRSQVEATYLELEAVFTTITALRDRIIPRAQRVFEETRRGYATGLFRYIEVLDAQRTLFEARRELLDAFTIYHAVATDLERLTATSLDHLQEQRP